MIEFKGNGFLENEIDEMVYEPYDLTPEENEIVDGQSGLTKPTVDL